MFRPTILVLLASYALLSYVDGTSNLPHVPGNVQPLAENSKDAPAKKVLRADETKENEERFNPIVKVREMRQDRVLKKILPQFPQEELSAISYSLSHTKMSSALKRFKGEEDKLLEGLSKSYGGVDRVISGLLFYQKTRGLSAENAKTLLEMQKKSWIKNGVDSTGALKKLKLTDETATLVIFNARMTFLDDYIKLLKPKDSIVDETFFQTLENGFGGRDKFFKLVTREINERGKAFEKKTLKFGGRYAEFLAGSNEQEKANLLSKTMENSLL